MLHSMESLALPVTISVNESTVRAVATMESNAKQMHVLVYNRDLSTGKTFDQNVTVIIDGIEGNPTGIFSLLHYFLIN